MYHVQKLTFFALFMFSLHELDEDSLCYGNHHGGCSSVAYPHGQETRDQHETQHQPARTGTLSYKLNK